MDGKILVKRRRFFIELFLLDFPQNYMVHSDVAKGAEYKPPFSVMKRGFT